MQQTESLETDATVCEIDAQKSEDCCPRKLAIKNGSNPVFEPNILAAQDAQQPNTLECSAVFVMAGAEGLEPSARGFGDHCSTN